MYWICNARRMMRDMSPSAARRCRTSDVVQLGVFRDGSGVPVRRFIAVFCNAVFIGASRGTCNLRRHGRVIVGMTSNQGSAKEVRRGFLPSDAWLAEFRRQYSDAMVVRLQVFATQRLGGTGGGTRDGIHPQARDLVAIAVGDTLEGVVRWYPERKELEPHLQDVIRRRTSLDWKRAKKFRHESIDATTPDGRSPILEELENTLVERLPDPRATENAQEAVDEVARLVEADPDVAAYVEARADHLKGRELMRVTGLTLQRYRRCRYQLDPVLKKLSIQARPRRRKRGLQS